MPTNSLSQKKRSITLPVKWGISALSVVVGSMLVYTYHNYLPPNFTGFLLDKKEIFYAHYAYYFYAHIFGAAIALFSGIVQVLSAAYGKYRLHRWAGKAYSWSVLLLAGPSGLLMGFFAIGGNVGIVNFVILSGLWWFTTLMGWLHIKKGNTPAHRKWMYRSFILAVSAVFLRIYTFLFFGLMDWTTDGSYLLASILSWLPNLLLLELYLLYQERQTKQTTPLF